MTYTPADWLIDLVSFRRLAAARQLFFRIDAQFPLSVQILPVVAGEVTLEPPYEWLSRLRSICQALNLTFWKTKDSLGTHFRVGRTATMRTCPGEPPHG